MSAPGTTTSVVVAWNGGRRLDACLESLRAGHSGDIILVDNGSGDEEARRLAARYGAEARIHLVRLAGNRGFAAGANTGFREALRRGAAEVLLVTQDVIHDAGAVGALRAAMASDPAAGIVGPVVLDSGDAAELSRGERFALPWLCVPRTLLRYRRRRPTPYEVSGVLGCAFLISRDCLEATGGFDPAFFAYYEEVDLCLRTRRLGYRVVCAPAACVRHDGWRGFARGFTPLSAELKARNLIRLERKHGGPVDWILFFPAYLALITCSVALYGLRGRFDVVAALLRGSRAGWRGRAGAPDSAVGAA